MIRGPRSVQQPEGRAGGLPYVRLRHAARDAVFRHPYAPRMKRPSYANVAATVALVVALGGTAYAAGLPRNSVGTPQLKKNAVTSAKVKPGTVAPSDLGKAARKLARSGPGSVASATLRDIPSINAGAIYTRGPIQGAVSHNDSNFRTVTPSVPLRASGFTARINKDLVPGTSVTVTLQTAVSVDAAAQSTALTCTITGSASTEDRACGYAGAITIPPGTFVWILYTISASGAVADPVAGYTGMLLRPTG